VKAFDVSNWGLIGARRDGASAGGAVIAIRTPGLHMLGGRDDVAVLWDIRVSPRERGRSTGSALFRAAEDWAGARGCRWLKIETQSVNVPACRFYQKDGLHPGRHRPVRPSRPADGHGDDLVLEARSPPAVPGVLLGPGADIGKLP
jgi:GNAT superfamily N-acetyltransferase